MRKSRLFVFAHLHKTAGMTFVANLRAHFEEEECLRVYAQPVGLTVEEGAPDQGWDRTKVEEYLREHASPKIRLVYGHMVYWGIHEHFGPDRPPFYMTFLRDPVERVISLYAYHRRFGGRWHQELAANAWSLDEWLERSAMLWRSDGQLRQLLWHAHGDVLREAALSREHLEEGKRLLERFAFVGTTETFEDDAAYLYGTLGLRRFHHEPVVNATPDKQDVPVAVRELIAERNPLDIELYEFATAQRERFLRSKGLSYRWEAKKTGVLRRFAPAPARHTGPPPELGPEAEPLPPRSAFVQLIQTGATNHDLGAPTLAVYASTGRTGSTFLCDLFGQSPIAAVLHGGLPNRVDRTIESLDEMLAAYLAQMTERDARVYVEGNPRFFEIVAQRYSIDDPRSIARFFEAQGFSIRCLFMVRNPRAYARSMKSRLVERGRDAWPPAENVGLSLKREAFERVYRSPAKWLEDQDGFGRICGSWVLRNRYLKKLMDLPECHFIRFEDLFGPDVGDGEFVQRIQEIHDHFQVPAYARIDLLLEKRHQPRNPSKRADELTDDEEEQLRLICGPDAAAWGYTL